MARRAYLYSTSLVLRWMVRLNIGVLLFLFAASPIVVPVFFNIARAAGNTYYVANAGLDSNVGTDTAHPWAHAPGMTACASTCGSTTLQPGDSVLFKRGDTWTGQQLWPNATGSSGNPLTFGAYGTGALPIFDGTGLSLSNLGILQIGTESYIVFDSFEVKNSTQDGIQLATCTNCTVSNCVVHDNQTDGVYFWDSSGSTITYNNIYHSNLAANGKYHGLFIQGPANGTYSGPTITHNHSHDNVGGNAGNFTNDANGIYIGQTGVLNTYNGAVISDNEIDHNGNNTQPAGQDGRGLVVGDVGGSFTITRNYFHDNVSSGMFFGVSATANATITYNVFSRNGLRGVGWQSNGTVYAYNNTIFDDLTPGGSNGGTGILTDGTGTFYIKNNIIATKMNSFAAYILTNNSTLPAGISNNVYWDLTNGAGGLAFLYNGTRETFAQWVSLTGETGSQESDPKLNNPASADFTLQSSSPAIDAGANLGSPYNMGLDPRSSFPWSTLDQGIYGSWDIGAFVYVPNLGSGNQQAPRYDFLNNSATSATSNHTLVFTLQNSLDNTGGSASDTLAFTFQSNFDLSHITCGDVNVATGTRFLFNVASPEPRTNCPNTATSWGLLVNSASRTITFTVPTVVKTYVATGTILTVSIGSNANYQNQGTHWIINPSDAGTKSITIGGTFGGYGQFLVSVNPALQVSAQINESLTLVLTGLSGSGTGGMNSCSSDGTHDAEDSASISLINTTAASAPFGTLSANTFYEGCQKVSVSTNAGNGYTIAVREDHSLRTPSGLTIADTGCDGSGCLNTPSTAAAWVTNTNSGLGISCAHSATSQSCWTASPNWINGTRWAPIASEGKNNPTGGAQTPAIFSGLSSATSVEVITKAKYRVAVPNAQAAGTYTNLVSFIATPMY